MNVVFILLGLTLLVIGGEFLVRSSVAISLKFHLSRMVIGLTVVSFATSAPELLVSLVASFKGSGGISLGNILGSNVINSALVLGISAMIKPVIIKQQIVKIETPYMIFISIVFWLLCMDSEIGRIDGIILLIFLIVFLIYGIAQPRIKTIVLPLKNLLKKQF